MLEEISIRDLGVIAEAVVELGPGLTVFSGETGAGKTMVMTALGLLLGGRGDSALVRAGRERLWVEARVRIDPDGRVASRAVDAGAELDAGTLILGRSVSAEGRSRAYLGGRSAPLALLAELGEDLVSVHGQHDQQRLLRPTRQRALLDTYGGAELIGTRGGYRQTYERLQSACRRLAELTSQTEERAREAALLRIGLAEIESVAPQAGEDQHLAAEIERLGNADALRAAARTAHDRLAGDPADPTAVEAGALIGEARRALEAATEHDDALADLAQRLATAAYTLSDIAADLASYSESVEADPLRLQAAHDRQAALAGLIRKYGATLDDVLSWARTGSLRLLELDADSDTSAELRAETEQLRAQLADLARHLSDQRVAAAARLAEAVTAELGGLAMPRARLSVEVTQRETDPDEGLAVHQRCLAFGPDGVDEVEVLLAAQPGEPARPVQRSASGGELSRIMLALHVVLAGADPVPTFVFDEVDAGVGGRAAVEVGRRLAHLAAGAQVLVVTHLPQVAAFADAHLLVAKSDDGRVTRTDVQALTGEDRVRELSRMLAGQEDSATARAHAEELLATAAAGRPQ